MKISIWASREIWLHTSANVKGHHNKGHYPEKAVPFCLLSLDWPPLHTLPVQDTKYQGFVHEYSRHPHCQVRLKRQSMHRGKPKLNKQMSVNKWNVENITSSWLNSDTSIFHITFLKETMLYKVHLKKKKKKRQLTLEIYKRRHPKLTEPHISYRQHFICRSGLYYSEYNDTFFFSFVYMMFKVFRHLLTKKKK